MDKIKIINITYFILILSATLYMFYFILDTQKSAIEECTRLHNCTFLI
jgi:hypothetical protein